MKIAVDDIFAIGGMHMREGKPCQDYTASGMHPGILTGDPPLAWIAVSDGCSNGRHTDVGARLWTRATGPLIGVFWPNIKGLEAALRMNVRNVIQSLDLQHDDLLATNLYAAFSPDMGATIRVRGDGAAAIIYKDGGQIFWHFSWKNNAPAYPVYAEDKFATYAEFQGGLTKQAFEIHTRGITGYNSNLYELHETKTVAEGCEGWTLECRHEVERIAAIALFTDGVDQVEGYTWNEVIDALLDFKTPNGVFVKRTFRGFQRAAAKRGRGPQDDIGYAVITVNDDEEANG